MGSESLGLARAAGRDDTLVALFLRQASTRSDAPALRTKRRGVWESLRWGEWAKRSRAIAAELVRVGVAVGDRVAVLANTREEWLVVDMAALLAGATTVPIYPTSTGEQAAFILDDATPSVLFVEDAEALALFRGEAQRSLARLRAIVLIDDVGREAAARALDPTLRERLTSLADVMERGRLDAAACAVVGERSAAVAPSDLATIVYTSGTTGEPKGVMLTQANFAFVTATLLRVLDVRPDDEQLLFLPMAHIFAKILVAMQLRTGFTTCFAESIFHVMDNATELNPTFIASVPRLFEKLHGITREKAASEGKVRHAVFNWAIGVGRAASRLRERGSDLDAVLSVQQRYADKIVLSKIRARFGNKLRFAISGGAPLAKELAEWYFAAGVPILEGYGLTETTAVAALNRPRLYRFGTVGPAIPGVELRCADDGEIHVRGPNVMRGYFNRPPETAEALSEDGWFATGDVGHLDDDGLLTITDRKKDIIVTSGGKNVAPQAIETLLAQSPWVAHALVHGDRRPYLVALVTLQPEAMERFARETGRAFALAALAVDSEVRARVQLEVDALNQRLGRHETIRRFAILPGSLEVERGEITPTGKVKRRIVLERYSELVDELYRSSR